MSEFVGRVQPFAKSLLESATGKCVNIAGFAEGGSCCRGCGTFLVTDFAIVGTTHQAWWSSVHGCVDVQAISFGNVRNPKHVVEHADSIGVFLVGG